MVFVLVFLGEEEREGGREEGGQTVDLPKPRLELRALDYLSKPRLELRTQFVRPRLRVWV